MIQKILGNSRYLILIAVIGTYVLSAIVILYDALLLVRLCVDLVTHINLAPDSGRRLVLEGIEGLDIFLLGTAFYIVALGLYELFIRRPTSSPDWLHVRDLDDLKGRLLGVVILVMSVFFLEQVINWDGKSAILQLGIAEALMIGAITLAITVHRRDRGEKNTGVEDRKQR